VATYREHGQALARGVSMNAIMAEMYGKVEGCSRGRGGSMHLFDAGTRFFGGNAIVGGGLPLAVGLALADKYRSSTAGGRGNSAAASAASEAAAGAARNAATAAGTAAEPARERCVTACFFGEGAVAEGAFHESLNLAALWQLPVLFICENNLYAMGTALARSHSQIDLTVKAAAHGLPTAHINGMNVLAVHEAAQRAVGQVRATQAPFFLELHTYRFRAHSMFDAELYRDKAEVERWKQHGPIHTFTDRLKAAGMMTEDDFQAIDGEAMAEVEAAVRFAEAGRWEPVDELTRDVMTPVATQAAAP
jgi:pyruvate dehydrogenase E1 component alpha subunit